MVLKVYGFKMYSITELAKDTPIQVSGESGVLWPLSPHHSSQQQLLEHAGQQAAHGERTVQSLPPH